jgi:hypothetical protein
MTDTSFKAWERRGSKGLGGHRTWKDEQDGESDLLSMEFKLWAKKRYPQAVKKALDQAVKNAPKGKIPAVIMKQKYDKDENSSVVLRYGDFQKLLRLIK